VYATYGRYGPEVTGWCVEINPAVEPISGR
jgi:hypothetical protein